MTSNTFDFCCTLDVLICYYVFSIERELSHQVLMPFVCFPMVHHVFEFYNKKAYFINVFGKYMHVGKLKTRRD